MNITQFINSLDRHLGCLDCLGNINKADEYSASDEYSSSDLF